MDVQGNETKDYVCPRLVQRLNHLNDLNEYTPIPDPTNNPGKQTPKFIDAKLSRIV
jgi:hypothetical protein